MKKENVVSLPECHARGSIVPSTHCRPEYRPGRCESKCTLSFSDTKKKKTNEKKINDKGNEEKNENSVYQDASPPIQILVSERAPVWVYIAGTKIRVTVLTVVSFTKGETPAMHNPI